MSLKYSSAQPVATTTTTTTTPDSTDTLYFFSSGEPHGYLCQWYPSRFTTPQGHTYLNCEQYMMHRKALLFAPDSEYPELIMSSTNPARCKSLGRKVPGFDVEVWDRERESIVEEGNWLKFSQDSYLRSELLSTGERELVEASPTDAIWGVGFGRRNVAQNRQRWGLNLLGKVLEKVRMRLREEAEKGE